MNLNFKFRSNYHERVVLQYTTSSVAFSTIVWALVEAVRKFGFCEKLRIKLCVDSRASKLLLPLVDGVNNIEKANGRVMLLYIIQTELEIIISYKNEKEAYSRDEEGQHVFNPF